MQSLLDRLLASAPRSMRAGVMGNPNAGPATQALLSRSSAMQPQGMPPQPATPSVTNADKVDVNNLGAMAFGWQAGPDQVKQNRTALVANTLNNMWGEPGNGRWGFNISPQVRQAWQEAGIVNPGGGAEGGPESDQEILAAIPKAYQRGMIDPEAVKGSILSMGGDASGLGGGTNTVNAPNFSGMTLGDAWRNAYNGMNDPNTGKFMGGFRQLAEVPFGSWGWANMLFSGAPGVSSAGDPGGLPSNGHGAGNPGR